MAGKKRNNFTHGTIVRYWIEWQKENHCVPPWDKYGWDCGEPSCMAGGWWKPEWDNPKTINARWNKSQLEKCHVIPIHMGGVDNPSNIVLMCSHCHDGQPDSTDPEITYAYMRERNLIDCAGASGALVSGLMAVANGSSVENAGTIILEKIRAIHGIREGSDEHVH